MFRVLKIEERYETCQGSAFHNYGLEEINRAQDDEVVTAVKREAQKGSTAIQLVRLIREGLSKDTTREMDDVLALRLVYEVCFNLEGDPEAEPEEFAEELISGVDNLWLRAVAAFSYMSTNSETNEKLRACIQQYEDEYVSNEESGSGTLAVSGTDGCHVQKAITLKEKKHVVVGKDMWRVKIKEGKLWVGKMRMGKWIIKNWGQFKSELPIIRSIKPFLAKIFNKQWRDKEKESPHGAYQAARDDEGCYTRWFVLNAIAGNITGKTASATNKTSWFRKQDSNSALEISSGLTMPLETVARCGALMELVKKDGGTTGEGTLAFRINVEDKYTTLTRVVNANGSDTEEYKANHGNILSNDAKEDYHIHAVDETHKFVKEGDYLG